MKIVNNNTNDKQTSGASLALDEDSPYTNSCLFTLDRLTVYRIIFVHPVYRIIIVHPVYRIIIVHPVYRIIFVHPVYKIILVHPV